MNKMRQFWALFKFQAMVNPVIWTMPLILVLPLFYGPFILGSYHLDLSSTLAVQNLFFVCFYGIWILAPEMGQAWGGSSVWSSGTEFLITRAIDRPILYRVRTALLYILVFAVPTIGVIQSLKKPDLTATEYSKVARAACLSQVEGATLERNPNGSRSPLIFIPRGNVLAQEWHLLVFALTGLSVQVLILVIYSWKHRLIIFYGILFGFVFGHLFYVLGDFRSDLPPYAESLFFIFAAHPVVVWSEVAIAMILGQLWCEERFCRLDL